LFYKIVRKIFTPLLRFFFPFEVAGKENLDKVGKNFMLCSNHVSYIDALFLAVISNEKINFLAKKELFDNPVFNFLFKNLGAIPVRRGKGDKLAILEAEKILNSGQAIGIFIEGTRSTTGEFLKPHLGAALIASRTGVKVVPACITPIKTKQIRIFRKTLIKLGKPLVLEINPEVRREISLATHKLMEIIKKLKST
jgi:1-acyl-sn-glycerol-3-phosphate acyltransferase